jgi:hypothetical protein
VPAVRHRQRPGRVGTNELEQDGFSRSLFSPIALALP